MKKQPVIVTIGSTQILLPDDTGAATVIKTLSRGLQGYHCGYKTPPAFEVTAVPRHAVSNTFRRKPRSSPATLPTMMSKKCSGRKSEPCLHPVSPGAFA